MQEDVQINVCCFHLALASVQARVKSKALQALRSASRLTLLCPLLLFYSDPVPQGNVIKVNVLGINPHPAACWVSEEGHAG